MQLEALLEAKLEEDVLISTAERVMTICMNTMLLTKKAFTKQAEYYYDDHLFCCSSSRQPHGVKVWARMIPYENSIMVQSNTKDCQCVILYDFAYVQDMQGWPITFFNKQFKINYK